MDAAEIELRVRERESSKPIFAQRRLRNAVSFQFFGKRTRRNSLHKIRAANNVNFSR